MSDKTLVERLREGNNANATCAAAAIGALLNRDHTANCLGTECRNCINEMIKKLADAIEREYLPRPRFEDGEPVQFGDKFVYDKSTGQSSIVFKFGYTTIDGCTIYDSMGNCSLHPKRPEPEVLDADGVPIKVGDTLWNLCNGVKVVVDGLRDGGFYSSIGGDYTRNPRVFSHKQPDSLERIEEDAGKLTCEYFGKKIGDCESCEGFGGCREKMLRDLLRRQREVLERGR